MLVVDIGNVTVDRSRVSYVKFLLAIVGTVCMDACDYCYECVAIGVRIDQADGSDSRQ